LRFKFVLFALFRALPLARRLEAALRPGDFLADERFAEPRFFPEDRFADFLVAAI
jgi:hypothetical protein